MAKYYSLIFKDKKTLHHYQNFAQYQVISLPKTDIGFVAGECSENITSMSTVLPQSIHNHIAQKISLIFHRCAYNNYTTIRVSVFLLSLPNGVGDISCKGYHVYHCISVMHNIAKQNETIIWVMKHHTSCGHI